MRPEKVEKEKEPSFQQDNTGQLEPQRVLHQRWRVLIKPNIDGTEKIPMLSLPRMRESRTH